MWLKVFGPEPQHDVYVASVYLPCAGSPHERYTDALLDLQEVVEHYLALAYTIFVIGDFKARVDSQASPPILTALRTVAPLPGESTVNSHDRALLQFCVDYNAKFVHGRSVTQPLRALGTGVTGRPLVWAPLWWTTSSAFAVTRR